MMNGTPAGTVINNYNNDNSRTVNQTNNSPKSLSRTFAKQTEGLDPPSGTISTSGYAGMSGSPLESMPVFQTLPVAECGNLHMILLSGKSALRSEREVAAQTVRRPQNSFRFGSRKRRFRDTAAPQQTNRSAAVLFLY